MRRQRVTRLRPRICAAFSRLPEVRSSTWAMRCAYAGSAGAGAAGGGAFAGALPS